MRKINLTNSEKVAFIDDEDYELVSQYKWFIDSYGYAVSTNKEAIKMHRLITNATESQHIDHINRNRLGNCRENLRFATMAENQYNAKGRKGTSFYKGVSWNLAKNRWAAQIQYNHKNTHIGYFKKEEEAAKAYDAKAKELFGEFAYLNYGV